MKFDFPTCKYRFAYEFIWDVNIYFGKKKLAFGLNTLEIKELFPLMQRSEIAEDVYFS